MYSHAVLLIQDVQILFFTIVFGVMALQKRDDLTRRWIWYAFLANSLGAIIDLLDSSLPKWLTLGLNDESFPLFFALLNIALVHFYRFGRKPVWVALVPMALAAPLFICWSQPDQLANSVLCDSLIAFECSVAIFLMATTRERSTRASRMVMGLFLLAFVCMELLRILTLARHGANLEIAAPQIALATIVFYVVNVSLLPLALVWMMHARLEANLLLQSLIDPLTGIFNRRGLDQALHRELNSFRRYGEELTLAMLDLDYFKQINDRYGHAAGDTILTHVTQFLSRSLRATDVVGRIGGEEFVLLLPRTGLDHALPILERLLLALRNNKKLLASQSVHITASLGIACTAARLSISAADLLAEADQAMYQAKREGRDRICCSPAATSAPQA
jgi:diguanylate cyclase (GGDEF)-like protein